MTKKGRRLVRLDNGARRPRLGSPADEPRAGLRKKKKDPPDPLIGSTIDNKYRILRKLGAGGMGRVYLATHEAFDNRDVALKVLQELDHGSRFRREAVATSSLIHPNIVEIIDYGEIPPRIPYIVMEHLVGSDLERYLKRLTRLDWETAKHIFIQVCSGLEAAHNRGIVHRDIKPENIFLVDPDGTRHVKLLDFGIAKVTDEDASGKITKIKQVMGTPEYMAPEQLDGQEVDLRADVYSVGVVLFEMLSGEKPFETMTKNANMRVAEVKDQQEQGPPVLCEVYPDLDIPLGVDEAIIRAVEMRAQDRFQSISDFSDAILSCKPKPAPAYFDLPSIPSVNVEPRPTDGSSAIKSFIIVSTMLAAAGLGWYYFSGVGNNKPVTSTPPVLIQDASPEVVRSTPKKNSIVKKQKRKRRRLRARKRRSRSARKRKARKPVVIVVPDAAVAAPLDQQVPDSSSHEAEDTADPLEDDDY
jgi:serine/threonine protein kinase